LNDGYKQPSATVDAQNILDVLAEVPPLEELAAAFRASHFVTGAIDQVSGSTGESAGGRLRVQGGIHVTMRCPGMGDDPVYDAAVNGAVSLTIAVAESSIRRDIGGQATKCGLKGRLRDLQVPVVIDGPVALDLGRDISLRSGWSGTLLMSIGELRIDDRFSFHDMSAKFEADGVEHLIPLRNGSTIVAGVGLEGSVRIRGRNGAWVCSQSDSCLPEVTLPMK
jgi:hypothetical protein